MKQQSRTQRVATPYGDVEVDLVDCASCGMEIREEDAIPFTIGEREAYACEHCEEEGPISYPEKVKETIGVKDVPMFFGLMVVLSPLLALAAMGWVAEKEEAEFMPLMVASVFAGGVIHTLAVVFWILPALPIGFPF